MQRVRKGPVRRDWAQQELECSRLLLSIMLLLWMSTPAEGDCMDDALDSVEQDTLLMDSTAV